MTDFFVCILTTFQGTVVKLSTSRGLTLRCDEGEGSSRDLTREVEVRLSQVAPFSSLAVPLTVLADLGPQRDAATVEHTVREYHLATWAKHVNMSNMV